MNKKGFTLIELLIVVAIIGIVAAIAIPNLLVALQKGKQKATMGDLKSVGTALEVYTTDNSFLPIPDLPQLVPTLPAIENFFIPFYIKVLPLTDSWGTAWTYVHDGTTTGPTCDQYTITSWGRDKATGGNTEEMYQVTRLTDFDGDITFSNGQFTEGPRVKK